MPAVAAAGLAEELHAPLRPLYVIHGEEELLRLEAVDALRAAAGMQGYLNRETYIADSVSFDWQAMLADAGSAGLFSDLKLLEIHIPNGKPGKNGADALFELANRLPPDTVTVLVLPKLDKTQTQSKWFSAMAKNGVVVEAAAVGGAALIPWIRGRLQRHGLDIEQDAAVLLAERVEGNLLAAKQEIDKLALLHPRGHLLTVADTEQAVANVAKFDVFQLTEAWMGGDAQRLSRLLDGLQAEGSDPVLQVWVLAEDVRTLIRLSAALKQGKSIQSVRNELRLWGNKQAYAQKAAVRLRPAKLMEALQQCAVIDRQIKGAAAGDAWSSFRQLVLELAV